ncbi:MAG: gamma-glutamylcyclotransferase [Hyphomicrobiaceae bacterium]|nr:MAG: gamma-glutamylcyclotransferase [Hyphomicrobiaceae bacterium]
MRVADHELWVFAYGSLMWRPGFAYEEEQHARLTGYRRCFCIYSMHHRGTAERPGMVLGLDRGGACEGIAYRISAANAAATLRYLREREQISGVYQEKLVPVDLIKGAAREVLALAYIVERAHPSYAGQLPLALQARLIRSAQGISGANLDYLISTLRHLAELGIRERDLERLLAAIGPHTARCAPSRHGNPCANGLLKATRSQPVPVRGLKLDQRRRFLYRLHLES